MSLGILGVLAFASTVVALLDPAEAGTAQALLVGIVLLLGLALFSVWMRGRTRRSWLMALAAAAALLSAVMINVTVAVVRAVGPRDGWWWTVWGAAIGAALWLLILAATLVELRLTREPDRDVEQGPGWWTAVGVAVPLALVVAVTVVLAQAVPTWMIRTNSRLTVGPSGPAAGPSSLSGGQRWTLELAAGSHSLPTTSGLAIPVPADGAHHAGVVLIDPGTGRLRWRYELPGVEAAPSVQSTDGGRAVVVIQDESELSDDIPAKTFTLAADTGRVQAFWPDSGEIKATDPPVLFDHVAQGANGVIAISPSGRTLWRYRPEPCADPRDVASTPTVTLVHARTCDPPSGDVELLGLDARTGRQRWVQPVVGERDSAHVLTAPDHRVELGASALQRRQLDTGAISWSVPRAQGCDDLRLAGAGDTVYVGDCPDVSGRRGRLTAYALQSGARQWQRPLERPASSMVAVDNARALTLVRGSTSCRVELVEKDRATALWSAPLFEGGRRPAPGSVNCYQSSVLRVGDSYVLQLDLPGSGNAGRYAFVGLR